MARDAASIPAPSDLLERICDEIEQRLLELRPALEERDELLQAAAALGLDELDEQAPRRPRRARSRTRRRARGARAARPLDEAQQAIVAALEHGSHTLAELALVTAVPASRLRRQVATLLDGGAVRRARRAGKSAYALAGSPD